VPGPSLRLIQDRLVNADGSAVSGTLQISWQPSVSTDGFALAGGMQAIPLARGSFSVNLAPGSYQVKYILQNGSQRKETWVVPSGSGPFRIAQVRQ
jgi:hypothetical protein